MDPNAFKITPEMMKMLDERMKDPKTKEYVEKTMRGYTENIFDQSQGRILRNHEETLRELRAKTSNHAVVGFCPSGILKKPSMLKDGNKYWNCTPILTSSLKINTTHTNRCLTGELIVEPFAMQSIHSVLKDGKGDIVKLSLPNMTKKAGVFPELNQFFPRCRKIAIVEPFYKCFLSGDFGVRVDDMNDIIFDVYSEQNAVTLKSVGNSQFKKLEFEEACISYHSALECFSSESVDEYKSLGNLALAYSKVNKPIDSLACCLASLLCSKTFKLFYRAAECTKTLGHLGISKSFATEALKLASKAESKLMKGFIQSLSGIEKVAWDSVVAFDIYCDIFKVYIPSQISDIPESKSAIKLRNEGNAFFKQQVFDKAIECYRMSCKKSEISSVLLSNISASHLKLGNYKQAFVYALLSTMLNPTNTKALYRRINALLSEKLHTEAVFICDNALKTFPTNIPLQSLSSEISEVLNKPKSNKSSKANPKTSSGTKDLSEQELKKLTDSSQDDDQLSFESVADMNALLDTTSILRTGKSVFSDCPNFHIEFSSLGRWPKQCDQVVCNNKLLGWYETGRSTRFYSKIEMERPRSHLPTQDFLMRLGDNERDTLDWYLKCTGSAAASIGSINPKRAHNPYSSRIHHSFGNAPYEHYELKYGTSHIAVGFVDLGSLFSHFSNSPTSSPLSWYGYESSPYAVAKTSVIAKMIAEKAPVDCILQAWFSSCWSTQTLTCFKTASKLVLKDHWAKGGCNSDEVTDLLECWNETPAIPLKEARKLWMDQQSINIIAACDIVDKNDRLSFLYYKLTGELLDCQVGSIMMFVLPKKYGEIAMDEDFLQCIPFVSLLNQRKTSKTFIDAGIDYFREKIGKLSEMVHKGHIHIRIYQHTVDLNAKQLISSIKALSPYSISWSNIVDYLDHDDFFKLAKSISSEFGTIHYAYSMNWILGVYGTFLIDYDEKQTEKLSIAADKVIAAEYKDRGIRELRTPSLTHIRNSVGYALSMKFVEPWFEHLMKVFGEGNQGNKYGLLPSGCYNTFARGSTAYVHFWFKID